MSDTATALAAPALAAQASQTPTGPPTPQPATVAARARAERGGPRTASLARVPFFADAAQPEIGQCIFTAFMRGLGTDQATRCSASPPEGPILPRAADRADRRCRPDMARYVRAGIRLRRVRLTVCWTGARWLQGWNKELQHGSRLAYFGLTTLLGAWQSVPFPSGPSPDIEMHRRTNARRGVL